MATDLTSCAIERQNMLNNPMALRKRRESLELRFLEY